MDIFALKDKVAVITGGASGIGFAIAKHLAQAGAHVMIADIEADKAAAAAAQLAGIGVRTTSRRCDVTNRTSVEELAEQAWQEFGRVDVIVNNAGVIGRMGPAIDAREEDVRWVTEVNYFGVWYGCSAFGRRFIQQGTPARLVITGSENSLSGVHPMAAAYTASKHALLGLAEVLRMELPDFIRVQILCPGMVQTQLGGAARNRPERFGGPVVSERAPSPGMSADEVGERTVKGIERGDFYIVTHAHDIELIERRYNELRLAFEQQAPRYPGDDQYDVMKLMRLRR
jgi:NAD(P)-dependent dehydrogenase (short-subunit alcohol dehydrogenase family)